ncbi:MULTISPECIES: ABC transporter permease [unclassified Empedobacter]|uniref:ABC transporter permease n=1 Tax=unclassified Empedobacter TaxID=2643773 RepID=UPI0025B7DA1B|nr:MULTISPECIES: ABC transporter permease [unclassified Empedobacter]
MTNTFHKAFASEQYKLSKNKEIFGVLLIPAIVVIMVFFYLIYKAPIEPFESNPWYILLGRYVFQFFYLLFPILIAVFVHSCCDVEYKNNNYKLLFTLPISHTKIYLAKALYILLIVNFSVILAYILFLLSGYLLQFIAPNYGFQNFDFREISFYTFLKLWIGCLAVSMVQFALSLFFRSFIYPIGFSIFTTVFCGVISSNKAAEYIPYSSSPQSLNNLMNQIISLERLDYVNLIYIIVLLGLNYFIFIRKKNL